MSVKVGFKQKIFFLYLVGLLLSVGLSVFSFMSQKEGMAGFANYIEFQDKKDSWRDLERFYQGKMNAFTLGSLRKGLKWKEGFSENILKEENLLKGLRSESSKELFNLNQSQKSYLLEDKSKDLLKSLKRERVLIVKEVQSYRTQGPKRTNSLMAGIKGWLSLLTYYSLGMSAIFSLFLYLYNLNRKSMLLLEKERKKRDFMLDSLDSAILLLDRNWNILSFNKKAKQLWRNNSLTIGKELAELLPSYTILNELSEGELILFDQSELYKNMKSPLVEKGFQVQISLPFQGVNPHWYQVEVKSFKDDLFLMCFQDVTHLIEAQELIKNQQKTLVEQSKMTALGQMSSGMAHEINNPLAIISSEAEELLEIAEDEGQVSQKDAETISQNIKTTTGRIAKIIKGLRIFARQTESNELVEASIEDVVDEVLGMASEKFKTSGVKFTVEKPNGGAEKLIINEVQIIQVMVNLLNNAYDAVKEQKDRKISFEWSVLPNCHLFTVSDNGPGIQKQNMNKIFDPFFTTKKVGQGTGLGLSLSRSIIEEHGGTLEVLPSEDGAKFLLKLPIRSLEESEEKWTA